MRRFFAFAAALTIAAAPTGRVEFTVYNTLPGKVYYSYKIPKGTEIGSINGNNSGKFSFIAPITLDFREAGKLPHLECGSITVEKQPLSDFYIRRVGESGCKITGG